MSEAYKIGVSLMMTSNAAGVLKLLGTEILGVHAKIKDLNKGLVHTENNIRRLNRIKLAVGGGVMMGAGIGIIAGLKHVTDHARELSHELVQLQKMNIGATEHIPLAKALDEVQEKAKQAAEAIKGVTRVDAIKAYGSAYSMFGHQDSLKMIQPMLRFAQVGGNTGGNYEQASNSLYQMIRSGDLMGKFVDHDTHKVDVERLNHFLELGSKVMLGTHGKVNAQTWLGLAQQGGPALSGMSDQGLYTMAIAAQAMGGPRAGTALTSLYQQMVGGKMTDTTYLALEKLGLAGGHTVMKNGKKVHVRDGVDQDFQERLKRDPIEAVELMQKRMKEHGFDTIEKQVPLLFDILGRQTTQRLVHDLLRNMPQIIGERERTKNALGVEDSKKLQDAQDYKQAEQNLKKAWEDLMIAVAGPNSQTAINIMNRLTDAIRSLTKYVDGVDPAKIEMVAKGLLVLGAALTAGGAVALLAALGPAGWLAAGLIGAAVGFAAVKDPMEKWIRDVTGMGPKLDAADRSFNAWAVSFGKWMRGLDLDSWDKKFNEAAKAAGSWFRSLDLDSWDKKFNEAAKAAGNWIADLGAEIKTWPDRLAGAISEMGTAIVEKIKEALRSVLGRFSPVNYEGGGAGGAGGGGSLIHNANLGTGGGGRGGGGSGPGNVLVPDSVAMTDVERQKLGLIQRFESQGRNVPNYINDRMHTAQGYYQITNSNWRRLAPGLGIHTPNAMASSREDQTRVALRLLRNRPDMGDWTPKARNAFQRGERYHHPAPASVPPAPAAKRELNATLKTYLDGRLIASTVTRHQFSEGNRPATGANMADASEHYPVVG